MSHLASFISTLLLLSVASGSVRADKVDDFVREQMKKRRVPGLSLAIIQDGKIIKAKGYGVIAKGSKTAVTPSTLFQAGSISKSVAAMGALRLVEQGKLSLDDNVNVRLTSWRVPENEFTKDKKVTLRGILSHTAGLTVHGFPGYEIGGVVPSVVQILDGVKPTNTAPIRVDFVPGSQWRYSGGGYTIMQQMIQDITGTPYPQFMHETVLKPLGMNESTYAQPPPEERAKLTATGHYSDRNLVKGRWHVYPEMAAAGLWTTPSDLARFAMGVQDAYAGKSGAILSQDTARQMLTNQKNNDGLGVFLTGSGRGLRFGHGGRDEGFDASLFACAETGQGVAIMINANDNTRMVSRITDFIAREYKWPDAPSAPVARQAAKVDQQTLDAYAGRYEFANNQMLTLAVGKGRLFTLADGLEDEEFVPASDSVFLSVEQDAQITFTRDGSGMVTGFVWKEGKEERKVPRIGPLARALKPQVDSDPALTAKIEAALKAFGKGGKAVEDIPDVAPGARKQFSGGIPPLAGVKALTFVSEQDVSGRGIERHGGGVARVRYYQLATSAPSRYLLVHLTAESLITDYDMVDE